MDLSKGNWEWLRFLPKGKGNEPRTLALVTTNLANTTDT